MMLVSIFLSLLFFGEISLAAKPGAERCLDAASKYDPCQNQELIYAEALNEATKQNKKLFLLFGADWCPWCVSFQSFLDLSDNKTTLENFVLANIAIFHGREGSPSGKSVIRRVVQMGTLPAGMSDRLPGLAIVDPTTKRAVFLDSLLLRESPDSKGFDAKKFKESVAKALRDLDRPLEKGK